MLNVKYKREIGCVEELMLYHQAASGVGGERIRLRELCLEMGRACLNKNPLLSVLKAAQICPRTRQRLSTERLIKETGQFSDCSCMLLNKSMSNKLTSLWTGVRSCPSFFIYILSICFVCLSARVHVRLFTVLYCIHKVLCACALTLSQEIKG